MNLISMYVCGVIASAVVLYQHYSGESPTSVVSNVSLSLMNAALWPLDIIKCLIVLVTDIINKFKSKGS
jgi:hypothetical protein